MEPPSVFGDKGYCIQQLLYRSDQSIAKAVLVHVKNLHPTLHTYLARTSWPRSDDHKVQAGAVARYEGDAGGSRCDVTHCLPHHNPVFTGDTAK